MSKKTAKEFGLDWELGNSLIRMDDGKINFALKDDETNWYKMISVQLPNGDSVGVPEPFDIGDIAKCKEKEKEEEKKQEDEVKLTEIALDIASIMTEDEQPQAEIISAYMAKTSKKETASKQSISMIPVGMGNAIAIFHNDVRTKIWRVRIGTLGNPRYTLHRLTDV